MSRVPRFPRGNFFRGDARSRDPSLVRGWLRAAGPLLAGWSFSNYGPSARASRRDTRALDGAPSCAIGPWSEQGHKLPRLRLSFC